MADYLNHAEDHADIEATPVEARSGDRKTWSARILIISTIAAAAGLFLYFGLYAAPPGPM